MMQGLSAGSGPDRPGRFAAEGISFLCSRGNLNFWYRRQGRALQEEERPLLGK